MANEKRLIDANALMDAFRSYMVERFDRQRCVSEENCKVCERGCLWRRVVSAAPTVDAVEVVHGRWVSTLTEEEIDSYLLFRCSACGNPTTWFTAENANYCPNCGAKMDGDRNA